MKSPLVKHIWIRLLLQPIKCKPMVSHKPLQLKYSSVTTWWPRSCVLEITSQRLQSCGLPDLNNPWLMALFQLERRDDYSNGRPRNWHRIPPAAWVITWTSLSLSNCTTLSSTACGNEACLHGTVLRISWWQTQKEMVSVIERSNSSFVCEENHSFIKNLNTITLLRVMEHICIWRMLWCRLAWD